MRPGLQKPGPGASVWLGRGGSGYRRAVEWVDFYSGKLTAVRGAARAPPESSLLLVREPAKSTGDQVLRRRERVG